MIESGQRYSIPKGTKTMRTDRKKKLARMRRATLQDMKTSTCRPIGHAPIKCTVSYAPMTEEQKKLFYGVSCKR